MPAKIMLAPNPNRNALIDRVIVVGASEDGSRLTVLSVDQLGKSEQIRRRYYRYFSRAANQRMLALVLLLAGIAGAALWQWWLIIPGLALAIGFWRASQASIAGTAARIVQENPSSRQHFVEAGLMWDAPAERVVSA